MIFVFCFHKGFTELGNLLETRSSLLEGSQYCPLLAACRVHTAPESSSPQIVTGRWNLGNLGPHHSVDLRLRMGWNLGCKTLTHWVRQGDLAAAHVQHLHHFPFFGDWVDFLHLFHKKVLQLYDDHMNNFHSMISLWYGNEIDHCSWLYEQCLS